MGSPDPKASSTMPPPRSWTVDQGTGAVKGLGQRGLAIDGKFERNHTGRQQITIHHHLLGQGK